MNLKTDMLRRLNSGKWSKSVLLLVVMFMVLAQVYHILNMKHLNNKMMTISLRTTGFTEILKAEATEPKPTTRPSNLRNVTINELILNKSETSSQVSRVQSQETMAEIIQTTGLKTQSPNIATTTSLEVLGNSSETSTIGAINLSTSLKIQKANNDLEHKVSIFVQQSKDNGVNSSELIYFTRLLQAFDKYSTENNVSYFLSSGSLLGLYRHGGIIPWDDDLDVLMAVHHFDKLCRAMNGTDGWQFIKVLNFYKLFSTSDFIESNNGQDWNWPYLDIFLYYKNNYGRRLDLIGQQNVNLNQLSVFPLRRMDFLNTQVFVPNDIQQEWLQNSSFTMPKLKSNFNQVFN